MLHLPPKVKLVLAGLSFAIFLMTAIVWMMCSPLCALPSYNMALFHPSKFPGYYDLPSIDGIKRTDVYFKSGNEVLHGWGFSHGDRGPVFLISHGCGANVTYHANLD